MKSTFRGYYQPTEEEFQELWKHCLFVLDANVLLNVYRYTPSTRDELLQLLQKRDIHDRLWIPHQAALEYHMHRLDVITKQHETYERIRKTIQNSQSELLDALCEYRDCPVIDIARLIQSLNSAFEANLNIVEKEKQSYPDYWTDDILLEKLTTIFEGRVGQYCNDSGIQQIKQAGAEWHRQEIPPDYVESGEEGDRQYGDLILWKQILEEAKEINRPVILVTDDVKEDWWLVISGKTAGPRIELVNEFTNEVGQRFYMYRMAQFLKYARRYLKQSIGEDVITEIQKVEESTESLEISVRPNSKSRFSIVHHCDMTLAELAERRVALLARIRHAEQEMDIMAYRLKTLDTDHISSEELQRYEGLNTFLNQHRSELSQIDYEINTRSTSAYTAYSRSLYKKTPVNHRRPSTNGNNHVPKTVMSK